MAGSVPPHGDSELLPGFLLSTCEAAARCPACPASVPWLMAVPRLRTPRGPRSSNPVVLPGTTSSPAWHQGTVGGSSLHCHTCPTLHFLLSSNPQGSQGSALCLFIPVLICTLTLGKRSSRPLRVGDLGETPVPRSPSCPPSAWRNRTSQKEGGTERLSVLESMPQCHTGSSRGVSRSTRRTKGSVLL